MTTALLDGETWQQASTRRFQEEAVIDARIPTVPTLRTSLLPDTLGRHKVCAAVCLHNYRQSRRHHYLVRAIWHVRNALLTFKEIKANV
jgi:hypothetical protein